jgi:acetyl esterase/lipase
MKRVLSFTIIKYFVILMAILCAQISFAQDRSSGAPEDANGPVSWPTGTAPQPPLMDDKALGAYTQKWLDLPYANKSEKQKLDIFLPNEGTGPFPVIVNIHGGGWAVADKRSAGTENVLNIAFKHGYAVVSVNHRFSSEATFPSQIQDVKAAIRWLRANGSKYRLNTQKIGVWGSSSGGHLAAMMGTSNGVSQFDDASLGNADQSSSVQAFVNVSGPINFLTMDRDLIVAGFSKFAAHNDSAGPESHLVGAAVQTVPDKVKAANPETYISKNSAPALIEYGMKDSSVSYLQATSLAQKLAAAIGSDKVGLVLFPEGGHGGGDSYSTEDNMNRIFAFFDRYIKSGGSEASATTSAK